MRQKKYNGLELDERTGACFVGHGFSRDLKLPKVLDRFTVVFSALLKWDFSVFSDSGPNPAAGIQAALHSSHLCVSLQSRRIVSTG